MKIQKFKISPLSKIDCDKCGFIQNLKTAKIKVNSNKLFLNCKNCNSKIKRNFTAETTITIK